VKIEELRAQLQSRNSEATQQAEALAAKALRKFESDLREQLSSVALTLRSDLETVQTTTQGKLVELSAALTHQADIMQKSLPRRFMSLKWLMLLPIGATLGVCVLAIAMTWAWLPRELWNVQTKHMTMSDGKNYLVIEDEQWSNCNLSRNPKAPLLRPCKTMETNSQ
jgi:hypothetical protein